MKNKGRGRPKLPKGEAKGSVITVRLQKQQRKILADAARRSGVPLSEWARDVLLEIADTSNMENGESEAVGIEPPGVAAPVPRDVKPR